MSRSGALVRLPSQPSTDADTDAFRASSQLPTQGAEDLSLARRVECALCTTGYGPLRSVEVTVLKRLVVLEGRVPSYYLKQVAQTIALTIPGTDQVRKDLDVDRPSCQYPGVCPMQPPNRDHNRPSVETWQATDGEPSVRQLRDKLGVLVVDDDHLVRIMVQLGLERQGFDVWLASNGREAIQLYRTHRGSIDVVLLDVCMPELDGPAILDGLRNLNPAVLACFMSGYPGSYAPDDLRQRGAACVIAKPFLLNELATTLRLLTHGVPTDLLPSGKANRG